MEPSEQHFTCSGNDLCRFSYPVFMQLLRNPHAGMPVQLRQRISELADGIFQATTNQVRDLDSTQQQVLVLELSQLGVVFINAEWHVCCPPVPVPLLNSLLDSLLQRLRTLRGGQVGVLLISLQRLQLCDSDAYTFILQEIERQLKFAKGENSWYRQPDHLGKLVRGVVTVFLVRLQWPNARARFECCCGYTRSSRGRCTLLCCTWCLFIRMLQTLVWLHL